MSELDRQSIRLDKWLWTARLFKTRQIAIDAINAGRVEVNGERVKPAKAVKPGDRIFLRKPPLEYQFVVRATTAKRVSATIARTLFEESGESVAAREKVVADLRDMPPPLFRGRPTKKDRRTLEEWQRNADVFDDADR